VHEVEEFGEDGCATSHGVELADASDHNGPSDTAGVAEDCSVYTAPYTELAEKCI
jgi:hypothetical protein